MRDPVSDEEPTAEFVSKLGAARQRFVAHVIEHGLTAGRRTPSDFVRHFPPDVIMEALEKRADLRAKILVAATGIKKGIAEKKSVESAAEDLRIALEVGESDAETIVALFAPDDRVRYLDNRALWELVAEGDFWKATDGIDFEIARAHVGYIIERALEESLIAPRDIVDGLGMERLTELLPREQLGALLAAALERGRSRKAFRDEDFLAAVPVAMLSEHVPLSVLWQTIVTRRIAESHGLVDPLAPPAEPEEPEAGTRRPTTDPPSAEAAALAFGEDSTYDVVNAAGGDGE